MKFFFSSTKSIYWFYIFKKSQYRSNISLYQSELTEIHNLQKKKRKKKSEKHIINLKEEDNEIDYFYFPLALRPSPNGALTACHRTPPNDGVDWATQRDVLFFMTPCFIDSLCFSLRLSDSMVLCFAVGWFTFTLSLHVGVIVYFVWIFFFLFRFLFLNASSF